MKFSLTVVLIDFKVLMLNVTNQRILNDINSPWKDTSGYSVQYQAYYQY